MTTTTIFWLRRARRGIIAWTLALAAIVPLVAAAYLAEASTPADAARFGASLEPFALSVRPLMGEPVALDTAAGFLHWRVLLAMPLVIGAYLIVFVTRLTVREEHRGASDLVLSTPLGRGRFMVERLVAVAGGCLVIGVAGMVLGGLGGRLLAVSFPLDGLFLAGLNLALILFVWSMLAALVAQFTLSRAIAGAASALIMIAVHVVANVATTVDSLQGALRVLPTGAYAASRPLVETVGTDPVALAILLAEGAALGAAATVAFLTRDLNVARRWRRDRRKTPEGSGAGGGRPRVGPLVLRGPFSRDLWALKGVTLAWAGGLAALMAFMVAVEPTLREPMEQLIGGYGALAATLAADLLAPGALVGLMFAVFLAPALAVFAALQAGRFAGELEDGLMVLDLSTPLGRVRLLLSRAAAVLSAAAFALLVCLLTATLVGRLSGVPIDTWTLARAAVAALTVVLVYLAVGLAVSGWLRPAWAAAIAGGLALIDFVYGMVVSLLRLPGWTTDISVFGRYGNPAIEGLSFSQHGVLLLVGALLVALAALGFTRRDLSW
jgi:ABC-2 type transport system permease protein